MSAPWDRWDYESSIAYSCFEVYLTLGGDRSVVAAYRQKTGKEEAKQASGMWNRWATGHEWSQRAAAYDSHLQEMELDARKAALKADEKKWAERRRVLREREFAASEQLIATAEAILAQPLLAEQQHATQMMKLGCELQRRATEMAKHEDEAEREQTGAKVIRFPVAVASAEEWSEQYKKA